MNQNLFNRRTEILGLVCKGVTIQALSKDLADKYAVSPRSIQNDWSRRQQWLPQIAKITDPTVLPILVQGLQEIIPNAWYEYKTADNSNARIGALRLAKEAYCDILEILQSVGFIEKKPVQVDQRIIVIKGQWWRQEPAAASNPQVSAAPETSNVP
jgi:hypothetical protein